MDANDMGWPDDQLMEHLRQLAITGFNFDDLLEAENQRAANMEQLSDVIDKHSRGPLKEARLPPVRFAPSDIPEFVDLLLESGFHHPGATASLAIRLTTVLRDLEAPEGKEKVREYLEAMAKLEESDLVLRLVANVCSRELD